MSFDNYKKEKCLWSIREKIFLWCWYCVLVFLSTRLERTQKENFQLMLYAWNSIPRCFLIIWANKKAVVNLCFTQMSTKFTSETKKKRSEKSSPNLLTISLFHSTLLKKTFHINCSCIQFSFSLHPLKNTFV